MNGPRSYGRTPPSAFGRKPEKQETWAAYEERMVREARERAELVKSIRRAHGIKDTA